MNPQPLIAVSDVEASSRWYQAVLNLKSGHGGEDYEQLVFNGQMVMQLHHWDATSSKEAFVLLDKQFRQLVVSASVKWIISEGDQASALVDYKMVLPSGETLDIEFSELIKVKDQKIASIKVLFDTSKFGEFLSKNPKN